MDVEVDMDATDVADVDDVDVDVEDVEDVAVDEVRQELEQALASSTRHHMDMMT